MPVVTPALAATWVNPEGALAGTSPAAKVTVLPLTVKVSPALTSALASPATAVPFNADAAVVAALIGSAAAWALVTRYMRIDFVWLPLTLTGVIAASIVAVVAIGLAGTWRALGHKPASLLRNG